MGRGYKSWVVGVGVGVGEELIMIIHTKLIATFALSRIALRRHPVKSPKNYTIFVRILPFVPKLGFFLSNVPPEISWAISKLLWLTSWTILSRFRHGIFTSFWYRLNVNITKRDRSGNHRTEKN